MKISKSNSFFHCKFPYSRLLTLLLLRVLPSVILVAFTILFLFTLLSRLGVLSVFGGAVVYSNSMEPYIRRWDIAFFAKSEPSKGDVVVYCLTRNFCVAHRYISDCPYGENCIITKGDANPSPDPYPVPLSMVKGVVLCVIPRELWLPLFLYAVASSLISVTKVKLIGLASTIVYATILVFILVVYGLTQPVPGATSIELPAIHLSKLNFDVETCTLTVSYVGSLQLTSAEVYVNGVKLPAFNNETSIVVKVPSEIAQSLNEKDTLDVYVYASLNHVGRLTGNYTVKVYPKQLNAKAVNGSLLLYNPNCFPVIVNVMFKYAYSVGDSWKYVSTQVIVNGCEAKVVEPPKGSRYAYADISYRLVGEVKWLQVAVKYG